MELIHHFFRARFVSKAADEEYFTLSSLQAHKGQSREACSVRLKEQVETGDREEEQEKKALMTPSWNADVRQTNAIPIVLGPEWAGLY